MELFEEICRYLENKGLKSVISVHIEKKQEKSSDVPQ